MSRQLHRHWWQLTYKTHWWEVMPTLMAGVLILWALVCICFLRYLLKDYDYSLLSSASLSITRLTLPVAILWHIGLVVFGEHKLAYLAYGLVNIIVFFFGWAFSMLLLSIAQGVLG